MHSLVTGDKLRELKQYNIVALVSLIRYVTLTSTKSTHIYIFVSFNATTITRLKMIQMKYKKVDRVSKCVCACDVVRTVVAKVKR